MKLDFGPRRGHAIDVRDVLADSPRQPTSMDLNHLETLDEIYRALCAVLYNYVPMSGHPGGSISSGRMVAAILFDSMDYDVRDPKRGDADIISYAAGHKALGLYAMWALRNEALRLAAPELLPEDPRQQLRLEDLVGFRRNPTTETPLFTTFDAKALDGHPTPTTPFVRLATGASGVGLASSLGLALGALDYYGEAAPRVHIVEGEGGLTPGRAAEALAAAGTSCLGNVVLHVDWNQASIDSEHVCRDGETPGDYVQWNPMELAFLHDWNVIHVPDGWDWRQILAAQRHAVTLRNGQPTAVVYRTTKGWRYGIEGKKSHGAGHKLCSDGFYDALDPILGRTAETLPCCDVDRRRCEGPDRAVIMERCFWEALLVVRQSMGANRATCAWLAEQLLESRVRLERHDRRPRLGAPTVERVYELAGAPVDREPNEVCLQPGAVTTLRAQLGTVLNYFNRGSDGALLAAAADLLDSTSVSGTARGFHEGYFNPRTNPTARLLSIGGICEDAMSGVLSGLSSYGHHIGVGSSYAAFLAPLGHIAARLHAIGNQARAAATGEPYRPMILICAHAGLKTGEDGPTHADPQALQLLQGNFPRGTMVTLTPWEPQEIWHLMAAALSARPAVVAPFVTRPPERVLDRNALGLAPASAARTGVYALRTARGAGDGTIVLQGSGVAYAFVEGALPRLVDAGLDLHVYYVASAELFDMLPREERERIFPEEMAREAMGITGFTQPTMDRWIVSEEGRSHTLHPFRNGHFPGSGPADTVMAEAGLDGHSQFVAVREFVMKRKAAVTEAV